MKRFILALFLIFLAFSLLSGNAMNIVYLLIIVIILGPPAWLLYWIIKIIINLCTSVKRGVDPLDPIYQARQKHGGTGGSMEAYLGGAVHEIQGRDGTYRISRGATMMIEHCNRNGERKTYYSVSEIQDSGDRQLVEQYLEEKD